MGTQDSRTPTQDSGFDGFSAFVLGSVVLSFLVIPLLVYWISARGGFRAFGLSALAFGLVTMVPGVLLGATSLLVMTGGKQ